MTDFFALLQQPRQPWLDPEGLKQQYHQLTRAAHPDVQSREPVENFETINEAYRVLLDPKLRVQHLLSLEGAISPATNRAVPEEMQKLFLEIGSLAQNSQRLLEKMGNAKSALSRSLLRPQLLDLQRQTQEFLQRLNFSYEGCIAELQGLNALWLTNKPEAMERLRLLYDRISYFSRWLAQLNEMHLQQSLHGSDPK